MCGRSVTKKGSRRPSNRHPSVRVPVPSLGMPRDCKMTQKKGEGEDGTLRLRTPERTLWVCEPPGRLSWPLLLDRLPAVLLLGLQ